MAQAQVRGAASGCCIYVAILVQVTGGGEYCTTLRHTKHRSAFHAPEVFAKMCSLPTVPVAQDGSEWDVLPTGWGSKGPKVPLRGIANAIDRPKMQKWGTMSREGCDHSLASKEYPTLRPNRIKPKAYLPRFPLLLEAAGGRPTPGFRELHIPDPRN